MIRDRPALGAYVEPGDEVWLWARDKFNGNGLAYKVYWDAREPVSAADAEYQVIADGDQSAIRLRVRDVPTQGKDACEDLWACVVYEFMNMENIAAMGDVYARAARGELDRSAWLAATTRLEFQAVQRTAAFFGAMWQPLAAKRGVRADPAKWYVYAPPTYEVWIKQFSDPRGYPWDPWDRYWREAIEPCLGGQASSRGAGQ